MSWKSFACVAALSAIVTGSALAAPSVSLVNDGLDANGDWTWTLSVTTDVAGSTASELDAALTGAGIISAALGDANFDTPNPSPSSLAWINEDIDGILVGGIQSNVPTNEAVVAVGSDVLVVGTHHLATFTTAGPSTAGDLTTAVALTGNVALDALNNAIAVSETRTAYPGDVDLDGDVDFTDITLISPNFGNAVTNGWASGDFNGSGTVDFTDITILSPNFGTTQPSTAVTVPEPTTLVIALVSLAGLTVTRRRS